MTGTRSLASCAMLVLVIASCGGQGGSASSSGGQQHLVFTGPAAGTLADAKSQCEVFTGQAQLTYLLTGTLGGSDLTLNIQIREYKGAGTYQVGSLLDGSAELRLQIGSYVGATATAAGTVTIDSGGRTGSVDANLSAGEHVKGTFRCGLVVTS